MKFQIVCQLKNRLRLRVGQYIFDREQGYAIKSQILDLNGVDSVKINPTNGSILVIHQENFNPKPVFSLMQSLSPYELPRLALPLEEQVEVQQENFQKELISLVGGHYFRKYFFPLVLPACISPWITWYCSLGFLMEGVKSLARGEITVPVLDASAIGASLLTKDYNTASSTMFLLKLSDLLLEYSNARAKNQLTQSLVIKSSQIWQVVDGVEVLVSLEDLKTGDVIRLRKGSMIPVDGKILSGDASINESTMNGEPLPVAKSENGSVYAGTLLEDGEIDVEIRSLGSETRIAQIVDFIQTGEETKASIQGKAERLADSIVRGSNSRSNYCEFC